MSMDFLAPVFETVDDLATSLHISVTGIGEKQIIEPQRDFPSGAPDGFVNTLGHYNLICVVGEHGSSHTAIALIIL